MTEKNNLVKLHTQFSNEDKNEKIKIMEKESANLKVYLSGIPERMAQKNGWYSRRHEWYFVFDPKIDSKLQEITYDFKKKMQKEHNMHVIFNTDYENKIISMTIKPLTWWSRFPPWVWLLLPISPILMVIFIKLLD